MENERYININLSNERLISLFNNRIEIRHNPYIINFIHNYDREEPYSNYDREEPYSNYDREEPYSNYDREEPYSNLHNRNLYNHNRRLPLTPLISDEIVLPAFLEQEFLISDDAVCGITFEKPDCCTPCGHHFCRAEITRWLKQQKKEHKKMTCPTCRTEIKDVIPDNTKRELNLYDVD
jgi:hypothetical protein